jgi:hypothetical protein
VVAPDLKEMGILDIRGRRSQTREGSVQFIFLFDGDTGYQRKKKPDERRFSSVHFSVRCPDCRS